MNKKAIDIIDELVERYPNLVNIKNNILASCDIVKTCITNGNKILVCGNGGSAADSEHIVGELMKGFRLPRKINSRFINKLETICPKTYAYISENLQETIPAISLVSEIGLGTAFANDNASDLVFAQQVYGYGKPGDVLLGISTSGNSKNVIYAAQVAQAKGMKIVSLIGNDGGYLKDWSDKSIIVSEKETYKIQELHLPIYHAICAAVEEELFG